MGYKFVDKITSDVMFEAGGKDLSELLEQSGLALFEIVCQIKKVKPKKGVSIKLKAKNEEELVHDWLSALLTTSDSEEMFFSEFKVKVSEKKGEFKVKGKAYGEKYSQEKSGNLVKGITYYNFKVEKTKKGYKATVVVDI